MVNAIETNKVKQGIIIPKKPEQGQPRWSVWIASKYSMRVMVLKKTVVTNAAILKDFQSK